MLQSAVPSSWLHFLVPILFLLISYGTEANNKNVTSVGIIIDVSTRNGKEEKTAMQIAAQNYNSNSMTHKLAGTPLESLLLVSCLYHFPLLSTSISVSKKPKLYYRFIVKKK